MKEEADMLRGVLNEWLCNAGPSASVSAIRMVVGGLLDDKGDNATISEALQHLVATKEAASRCKKAVRKLNKNDDSITIRIVTTSVLAKETDKRTCEGLTFFFKIADARYGEAVNRDGTLESLDKLNRIIEEFIAEIKSSQEEQP